MCVQNIMYNYIGDDQFSYKKGHNSTMALKKWPRVFSFDFSKAFDNVPHDILFKKIKKIPINPYITNWQMHILTNRSQRVEIDDVTTKFLNINRGVPQGTVRGPIMFTVLVNDIKAVNT